MHRLLETTRAALRRRNATYGLAAGLAVAAVLPAGLSLLGVGGWGVALGVLAAGAGVGWALGFSRPVTELDAARWLDARGRTGELLATACLTPGPQADDAMLQAVCRQAQRQAAVLSVINFKPAMPGAWVAAAALAAAAGLLAAAILATAGPALARADDPAGAAQADAADATRQPATSEAARRGVELLSRGNAARPAPEPGADPAPDATPEPGPQPDTTEANPTDLPGPAGPDLDPDANPDAGPAAGNSFEQRPAPDRIDEPPGVDLPPVTDQGQSAPPVLAGLPEAGAADAEGTEQAAGEASAEGGLPGATPRGPLAGSASASASQAASQEAARAVAGGRVPVRHIGLVREYFDLPD
ncbi:MAG: hypothetical protein ACFCVE_12470 [Phycisphaerae bacterium]